MTEELKLEGLAVAPGVLGQIVTLAASGVEGVAGVGGGGIVDRVRKTATAKGVAVDVGEDGSLSVALHIAVDYGLPLRKVAQEVQKVVSEALASMTGQRVSAVDVFVDSIVFVEK